MVCIHQSETFRLLGSMYRASKHVRFRHLWLHLLLCVTLLSRSAEHFFGGKITKNSGHRLDIAGLLYKKLEFEPSQSKK